MATLASDWPRHFRLLLWNRLTEFNEIWQEARSQHPLPSFVIFVPIGKTRWPPWSLICWDIFDFSSETAERNSTKVDRKQVVNVLYQICGVFFGQSEKQDGHPGLWLAATFSTSPLKPLNRIQRNLTGSKNLTSSTKFFVLCFSAPEPKALFVVRRPSVVNFSHFRLLLWNRWTEFNETWKFVFCVLVHLSRRRCLSSVRR